MKQLVIFTLIVTLYAPLSVFGAEYVPLVGIPGVNPNADFSAYINSLYVLSISVAALLAVIKIVIAGVKWMLTDIVTSKGQARDDIQGAIIGLLVVLAAVLILTVINPNLTNVNITFDKLEPINIPASPVGPATLTTPKTTTSIAATDATLDSIPAASADEQKQLFINECDKNKNTKSYFLTDWTQNSGSAPRCITHGANETSQVLKYCSTPDCSTVYKNIIDDCTVNKKGSFLPDSEVKNFGVCVYPK